MCIKVNEYGDNAIKIIYKKYEWKSYQVGVQPRSRFYKLYQHIAVNIDIISTNIWIQTNILQQCSGRITLCIGNIYNKLTNKKQTRGAHSLKRCKCITYNIDIVTVTYGTISLVSVVNPSYYHWVFIEGTGLVAGDFLFFKIPCCTENLVGCRD